MKAPAFWREPKSLLARALSPLGSLYGLVTAWRMKRRGRIANVPVICIGNLTAGGAGKTPLVLALGKALIEAGERPVVVSRGYGGSLPGPVQVLPDQMRAAECGDEPLLLARTLPVIVARQRLQGVALAEKIGASLVLLDDGLQNPQPAKDVSIAVIDAGFGFGNGFCIPAGPLRAPVASQIQHVDAVVIIGLKRQRMMADLSQIMAQSGKPVLAAFFEPNGAAVAALRGRPLLAFAGIGRPQKFFETLADAGLEVTEAQAFADHHPYTQADLEALRQRATARALSLVTTEKDWVRLPAGSSAAISVLPVTLMFETDGLSALLSLIIARKRSWP